MGKLEKDFQSSLKKELKNTFPGSMVFKLDPGTNPSIPSGTPDLLVLYKDKWAALECKRSKNEAKRIKKRQKYKVEQMDEMSFSRVIFPENKEEVMNDLQKLFKP